jgi:hypothetical protein
VREVRGSSTPARFPFRSDPAEFCHCQKIFLPTHRELSSTSASANFSRSRWRLFMHFTRGPQSQKSSSADSCRSARPSANSARIQQIQIETGLMGCFECGILIHVDQLGGTCERSKTSFLFRTARFSAPHAPVAFELTPSPASPRRLRRKRPFDLKRRDGPGHPSDLLHRGEAAFPREHRQLARGTITVEQHGKALLRLPVRFG